MPEFPKNEADIAALAGDMIGGYLAQPALFPHADAGAVQAALSAFEARAYEKQEAHARAMLATRAKAAALQNLVQVMKKQLRQSEADAAAAPQSLDYIRWGPRAAPEATAAPGEPLGLQSVAEDATSVTLHWKSPAPRTGGRVRTYVIERREHAPGQPFSDWHQVGIALSAKATLTDQPRAIQLEYRVIAVNTGGASMPSNVAAVVL